MLYKKTIYVHLESFIYNFINFFECVIQIFDGNFIKQCDLRYHYLIALLPSQLNLS